MRCCACSWDHGSLDEADRTAAAGSVVTGRRESRVMDVLQDV